MDKLTNVQDRPKEETVNPECSETCGTFEKNNQMYMSRVWWSG